jgi:hypothetical protein
MPSYMKVVWGTEEKVKLQLPLFMPYFFEEVHRLCVDQGFRLQNCGHFYFSILLDSFL